MLRLFKRKRKEIDLGLEYEKNMAGLIGYLSLKGERRNLREINELQRSLSDMAIHAYKHSDFFTVERVNYIRKTLGEAETYLSKTKYHELGVSRASSFVGRVLSCKKAAYSTRKLEEEFSKLDEAVSKIN